MFTCKKISSRASYSSVMKKTILKIIRTNILFFIIVTAIIASLNLTPLISDIRHSPPGRSFAMIHNNVQDFFFYEALMNEGANGANLIYDPYTTESHQSTLIFAYFTWFGKISKLFGISHAITYHAIRVIFGILLLWIAFKLLYFIKIPYPKLSFIFFVFAAPLLHEVNDYGLKTAPYMSWWTGMDPIRRFAYLPHHMIGSFLLVITIFYLLKFVKENINKYLLISFLLIFPLVFFHPPSLFILLITLPPSVFIYFALNNIHPSSLMEKNKKFIGLLVYWVIGLLLMLLMLSQTNKGFPWSQYMTWERISSSRFGRKSGEHWEYLCLLHW